MGGRWHRRGILPSGWHDSRVLEAGGLPVPSPPLCGALDLKFTARHGITPQMAARCSHGVVLRGIELGVAGENPPVRGGRGQSGHGASLRMAALSGGIRKDAPSGLKSRYRHPAGLGGGGQGVRCVRCSFGGRQLVAAVLSRCGSSMRCRLSDTSRTSSRMASGADADRQRIDPNVDHARNSSLRAGCRKQSGSEPFQSR